MRVICHSQSTAPTGIVRLPSVNEETAAYLANVLSYIEENYASRLTLQDLAHQFGINYSYLSQLFKKATNQTFEKHLAHIRLTHACRLLSHTYMPIADIAEKVGFRDYHYFCTAFKRFCSMTPSQYRDAHHTPTDA
nr:AraC family transcriptional regulator [uncultured Acetatifactor sp.]